MPVMQMLRRAGARTLAAGTLVVLSALPAALGAQARQPRCAECEEETRRVTAQAARDAERQAEREIRVARREIARLLRRESHAEMKRALQEADKALDRVKPGEGSAAAAVGRVRQQLATARAGEQGGSRWPGEDNYTEIMGRLAGVQARLVVVSVNRAMVAEAQREGRSPRAQTGWLGVDVLGDPVHIDDRRGSYFHYKAYPVIAGVEPGSPAEAAGLAAGDTIVAFDGVDVRNRKIFFSEVLRPGNKLRVRVRRAGRALDARIAVRPRPASDHLAGVEVLIAPGVRLPRGALRVPAVVGPTPVVPPAPPAPDAPMLPGFWRGPVAVAGAELARVNGDLRDAFDVPSGVLVLNVGRGSPAAAAGLRAGDVIVRVDGRATTSPEAVQRAVQAAHRDDGRRVEFDLVRKSDRRTVVLKW